MNKSIYVVAFGTTLLALPASAAPLVGSLVSGAGLAANQVQVEGARRRFRNGDGSVAGTARESAKRHPVDRRGWYP